MTDFSYLRNAMIENQLRTNQVTNPRILDAMASTPREKFMPLAVQSLAYCDDAIDISKWSETKRLIMAPMAFGRLVQAARPENRDVALIIGCGSGYSAAVLSKLASSVVAVESDRTLATKATDILAEQGIENAVVINQALAQGWRKECPYDLILIDGAIEQLPQTIVNQLRDGGRLVCALCDAKLVSGYLYTRRGGNTGREFLFNAAVPLLPGFKVESGFIF